MDDGFLCSRNIDGKKYDIYINYIGTNNPMIVMVGPDNDCRIFHEDMLIGYHGKDNPHKAAAATALRNHVYKGRMQV